MPRDPERRKEWLRKYQKEYRKTPQRQQYCKDYQNTPQRKQYIKDYQSTPEYKEYHKEYNEKLKIEILSNYGNGKIACVKCGFLDIRALQVDHVNGGGHKKGIRGSKLYKYLKDNNYPPGYQTLCANCNWIKSIENGEHQKNR